MEIKNANLKIEFEDINQLEVCETNFPFLNQKQYTLPPNLKFLGINYTTKEDIESIIVPEGSKLERIHMIGNKTKQILFGDKLIQAPEGSRISDFRVAGDKLIIFYLDYYEIRNISNMKVEQKRKL